MAECKPKLFDCTPIKEWIPTSGKFIKTSTKPGCPGAPKDDKESLTKWLVFQFQIMVLACIAEMVRQVMLGYPMTGVTFALRGILSAWLSAWFTWFAYAEREPSFCCFGIGYVENWKFMHLIWGILLILGALSNLSTFLMAFIQVLQAAFTVNVDFILYAIAVGIYCLYAVGNLGVGICLVKMGGKKAGIDIPEPEKVGA